MNMWGFHIQCRARKEKKKVLKPVDENKYTERR